MKDIDFLPIRYRPRTPLRRDRVALGVVVCCLSGFLAAVALPQLGFKQPIGRQLTMVNAQSPPAVAAATPPQLLPQDLS